jgi:hypothetical protein
MRNPTDVNQRRPARLVCPALRRSGMYVEFRGDVPQLLYVFENRLGGQLLLSNVNEQPSQLTRFRPDATDMNPDAESAV